MDFFKQYPSGLRLVAKRQDNSYTVSMGVFVDVGAPNAVFHNFLTGNFRNESLHVVGMLSNLLPSFVGGGVERRHFFVVVRLAVVGQLAPVA